jgi:hypothetical protein
MLNDAGSKQMGAFDDKMRRLAIKRVAHGM